jgi:uracil-DNA glycosylase
MECDFVRSFNEESLPEHNLPPHWSWWFRNKWPSERNLYYTFFRWNGFSDIIFVTLRPSTAWAPDTADFLLASALKANGLVRERFEIEGDTFIFYEGVLITDLIKCRGKAKEVIRNVPKNCLTFIKEELAIVRECSKREPRIIAVGRDAQRLLYKHKSELGIKVYKSLDDVPWIYLHNYAEWQGKPNIKRGKAFQEYAKQIGEAVAKAKPMRTQFSFYS